MSYNMYILMEPDADNGLSVLQSLNNIVQAKNENPNRSRSNYQSMIKDSMSRT